MADLLKAFLSDIVNDSVNGNAGPTDWANTDAALAELDAEDVGPRGTSTEAQRPTPTTQAKAR